MESQHMCTSVAQETMATRNTCQPQSAYSLQQKLEDKWNMEIVNNYILKVKVKIKLSLCLTKHHAMNTYWGVEV
jgi:hypothetical protein